MSTVPQIKAKAELGAVDPAEVRFLIARLESTQHVLADRERELLAIRGQCSADACTLHYAHFGPCNMAGRLA